MRMRSSCCFAVSIALLLAGCQSLPGTSSTHDDPPPSADMPVAGQSIIRGKATYLQRIKIAPGASLLVQLIDNQLADTPKAVIAQATFEDVAGPPYAFELPYDASALRANGLYGLHASLRSVDGKLLFVTDTRVPFTPGHDDIGEFVMTMVNGAKPSQGDSANVPSARWRCDELLVASRFPPDKVELSFSRRRLTLAQARSGSGARYADDMGNEFWTKGNSAMFTLAGDDKRDCSITTQTSP